MERRILFRWTVAARRFVPNWLLAVVSQKPCREVAYKIPEDDDRAVRIGTRCPGCVCEHVKVGRFGSLRPVGADELLHSVVIAPTDLDKTALAITMITHAEKKGMSVLRAVASNDEFKKTIALRLKKPNQSFFGIATFGCAAVRGLAADKNTEQRRINDRLYYVLDTDMDGLPNHAEVFATVPRPFEERKPKSAWRSEREALLDLLTKGLCTPAEFRNGAVIPQ